jgi:ATP-dependent RNA circularization protein (DNA/RNA ligase family)
MCEEYENACGHRFFVHRRFGGRRFLTKEETTELKERYKKKKIKWLEHYKESLENELKGVSERLEELEKD